ncbi:MAG: agmatine deiminase [Bacilli bacterium]|nr:agmatine deiminase [Bacilli bacterium]
MSDNEQSKTPFVEAIKEYVSEGISPFDVPGHHMGNIENDATSLFGRAVYQCDVNAPVGLDNLAKPSGVILEAENLLAKACGADEAFFLINGTSSGIIAMIMTACKATDKIILPRNIHKSVINALVLSGAVPEYIMPEIDSDLEIANQPSVEDYKKAMLRYPSAKAVFVINPTYFGGVLDLKEIVRFAHERNMAVLVDEAHGAHYYFGVKGAPISAMEAGADMSSASFHKTAGSLTQSSVLLLKKGLFTRYDVQKSLNILNSTSPSPILIGSIDAARAYMASDEGKKAMEETYKLAKYARKEISNIPGFKVITKEHFLEHGCFDYDETKLVIGVDRLDLDGHQIYTLLKTKYQTQMELGETYAFLGILAIGSKKEHIDHLVESLKGISKEHFHPEIEYEDHHFDQKFPYMLIRPRAAFHAAGKVVPIEECDGAISKEQVMIYPPGIPIICPGEVWTKKLISRVSYYQENGFAIHKAYPNGFEVVDLKNWKRYSFYQKKLEDYYESRTTTPSSDGYRLPFEGDAHQATFILLPFRRDTWRKGAKPALAEFKQVVLAIAEHEKVIVGIHPSISSDVVSEFSNIDNVSIMKVAYNDSWARDNTAIFLNNGKNVRAVNFRFNAWGGTYDGLYSNWRNDDKLGSILAKRLKMTEYYHPSFIFEGGAVACDGEGTCIVTEACLLSPGRNPNLTKEEIEETLKSYLSVDKVIWVPHGIYNDETDEHIDNMVAFVKPGEVVMAWSDDKNDRQYDYCQQTYKALVESEDAKGRKLVIHKINVPSPYLFMTKEEAASIQKGKFDAVSRFSGNRLAASYINFYQGKDFVVMPSFNVKEDKEAYEKIKALFPNKKIHQIYSREILLGGGNIHCITMQIPEDK